MVRDMQSHFKKLLHKDANLVLIFRRKLLNGGKKERIKIKGSQWKELKNIVDENEHFQIYTGVCIQFYSSHIYTFILLEIR